MQKINFPYLWNLKDGYTLENNYKVFGSFVCAGGSTMGYKLAGFNHLGGVELTKHYSELYIENHKPIFFYNMDIRDFNNLNDLPIELFNIDLLDGSPPCASFSTAGAREKKWGKEKKYEGHTQKTDDLVFEYVKLINKLKPKTFIMENVSGLIKGNAKVYVKNIFDELEKINYKAQIFSLNGASMGVPQMRQRVFIIGHKKELNLPKLVLNFNQSPITFKDATEKFWNFGGPSIVNYEIYKYWKEIDYPNETTHKKRFSLKRPSLYRPCYTLTESNSNVGAASVCHPLQPRKLNKYEACAIQSFPQDFNFLNENPLSCIGRSVPPVMMAQISYQVKNQWLDRL